MKTPPTIIACMEDPTLFGKWFAPRKRWFGKTRDSWANWKTFLAALFGLALTDEQRAIYKRFTGRDDVLPGGFRELYVICGRRGGKSLIAALIAVYVSCFIDHSAVLIPGESAVCMIIASDKRQARIILGYVVAFLNGIPMLKRLVKNVLKESVELTNGIVVEIHCADYRSVRGFSCVGIICDETNFWASDTNGASPDSEILNAVRPSLATTNGLLLCVSSPYSKRGVMFDAYKKYFAQAGADTLVWKAGTREMNPTISDAVVSSAYKRDFSAAQSEYGGEFRNDIEGFLSIEAIEGCTVSGRHELSRIAGISYSAFTDPSAGRNDSFTVAIAHDDNGIGVLDVLREIRPPFSPEQVVTEYAALLKSYGIYSVVGDKYASEFNVELWRKAGIEYDTSELSRSEIYLNFLSGLMSGKVRLLDQPRLKSQLLGLERKIGRGADVIDHGPNQHDDCSNSAAGVLTLVLSHANDFGLLDFLKSERAVELYRADALGMQGALTPEKPAPPQMSDAKAAWWAKEQRRLAGLE